MSNNSSTRTIIILPDDTKKPIVDAIDAAKSSIKIKMFVFSDPDLINAVIAAKKRGINVQVMLNPGIGGRSMGETSDLDDSHQHEPGHEDQEQEDQGEWDRRQLGPHEVLGEIGVEVAVDGEVAGDIGLQAAGGFDLVPDLAEVAARRPRWVC